MYKLVVNSVDDFFDNFENQHIERNVIYADVTQDTPEEHIVNWYFQAYAVLKSEGAAPMMIALGINCGQDILTADGEKTGSKNIENITERFQWLANQHGCKIKPGVLTE